MCRKPNLEISGARGFSKDYENQGSAVVRLSSKDMRNKSVSDAWVFPRGTWVWIKSGEYRNLRKVRGGRVAENCIELDYDSRLELGIESDDKMVGGYFPIDGSVRKASWIGRQIGYWKIPDDTFVIAHRLGVLGVTLGVLGVILGVIGVILGL